MGRAGATRPGPAILAIALLVMACSSSGSTAPPTTSTAAAPTPLPSIVVATFVAPSPSAIAAAPPAASLSVEGGDPATGQLGSYAWNGGGSDSPWLAGTPMTVGVGEQLRATLGDGIEIATWSASCARAGSLDGAGAVGLGDGRGPIAFATPETGRWSVQLLIRFAGDLGSAAYYWQVTVR
jgi:hypothetical protein